jgi:hypothetical protein
MTTEPRDSKSKRDARNREWPDLRAACCFSATIMRADFLEESHPGTWPRFGGAICLSGTFWICEWARFG